MPSAPPCRAGHVAERDALAIIVSEETGSISIASKGTFRLRLSAEELEAVLTEELG